MSGQQHPRIPVELVDALGHLAMQHDRAMLDAAVHLKGSELLRRQAELQRSYCEGRDLLLAPWGAVLARLPSDPLEIGKEHVER